MKKIFIASLCFVSVFACKKEEVKSDPSPVTVDTIAPVITLNGKQKDTVAVLTTYTDPGATATDNSDGNISSKIVVTGSVSTTIPGITYTLNYNVADQAGNAALTVSRTVYVKPAVSYILSGAYNVACAGATINPGVDPVLNANSNYTSSVQLSGQTGTLLSLTSLNIGPVTAPTFIFGVNAFVFSISSSIVNAPAQTFAMCTGTVSPSKTSFTIDTKYYETMYPNKSYETRNVFTKQ